jgi:hypothetical protein
MQEKPVAVAEVIPLLDAVLQNAEAPESALAALHRAWWHSIYSRIEDFEGVWEVLSNLMDELDQQYEPNDEWRNNSSQFYGPAEAVQRVQRARELLRSYGCD